MILAKRLGYALAEVGGELLMMTLPGYLSGVIKPFNQDNNLATYAAILKKKMGSWTSICPPKY